MRETHNYDDSEEEFAWVEQNPEGELDSSSGDNDDFVLVPSSSISEIEKRSRQDYLDALLYFLSIIYRKPIPFLKYAQTEIEEKGKQEFPQQAHYIESTAQKEDHLATTLAPPEPQRTDHPADASAEVCREGLLSWLTQSPCLRRFFGAENRASFPGSSPRGQA